MDYTRLGKTGLEVSRICFGTMSFGKKIEKRPWALSFEDARPMYRAAWEGGINFFDTANAYNEGTSEVITGKLIKELAPPDEIVLATKVFNRTRPGPIGMGLSRKAILHEIDESLRRLGTDISTSTRSTATIPSRPTKRRWKRSTMWCEPARPVTSARRRCGRGSS
jgi:aryl-alcohol dehydrogenase-like predicted oxidoreductase